MQTLLRFGDKSLIAEFSAELLEIQAKPMDLQLNAIHLLAKRALHVLRQIDDMTINKHVVKHSVSSGKALFAVEEKVQGAAAGAKKTGTRGRPKGRKRKAERQESDSESEAPCTNKARQVKKKGSVAEKKTAGNFATKARKGMKKDMTSESSSDSEHECEEKSKSCIGKNRVRLTESSPGYALDSGREDKLPAKIKGNAVGKVGKNQTKLRESSSESASDSASEDKMPAKLKSDAAGKVGKNKTNPGSLSSESASESASEDKMPAKIKGNATAKVGKNKTSSAESSSESASDSASEDKMPAKIKSDAAAKVGKNKARPAESSLESASDSAGEDKLPAKIKGNSAAKVGKNKAKQGESSLESALDSASEDKMPAKIKSDAAAKVGKNKARPAESSLESASDSAGEDKLPAKIKGNSAAKVGKNKAKQGESSSESASESTSEDEIHVKNKGLVGRDAEGCKRVQDTRAIVCSKKDSKQHKLSSESGSESSSDSDDEDNAGNKCSGKHAVISSKTDFKEDGASLESCSTSSIDCGKKDQADKKMQDKRAMLFTKINCKQDESGSDARKIQEVGQKSEHETDKKSQKIFGKTDCKQDADTTHRKLLGQERIKQQKRLSDSMDKHVKRRKLGELQIAKEVEQYTRGFGKKPGGLSPMPENENISAGVSRKLPNYSHFNLYDLVVQIYELAAEMHAMWDFSSVSFCYSLQQLPMQVLTTCMEKMSAQNAAGASDAQGPDTTTPERQLQKCLQEHQCKNKHGRMLKDFPDGGQLILKHFSVDSRKIGNSVAAESSTSNNLLGGTQKDGAIFQTPPRPQRPLTSMSPGSRVVEAWCFECLCASFCRGT